MIFFNGDDYNDGIIIIISSFSFIKRKVYSSFHKQSIILILTKYKNNMGN